MVTQIKNPRVEIKVYQDETLVLNDRTVSVDDDLHIDFEIEKSLNEEPNDATITIYNLNEATRSKLVDSSNQYSPIEIYITPGGFPETFVLAYSGEVNECRNHFLNPGHETVLWCTSEQENHRSLFFNKEYEAGTSYRTIIDDMITAINLPRGFIETIPDQEILMSESFSGPAFPILQRYVFDMGLYAYILDGKILITDREEHGNPTVFNINEDFLLQTPQATSRVDKQTIMQRTVTQARSVNPFARQRKRRKKTKTTKVNGDNGYTEYEATDKTIEGMDFTILCIPGVQPDDIIPYDNRLFRVRQLMHYGDNYGGSWTTELTTDVYDDLTGDLRERVELEKGFLVDVPKSLIGGEQ